MPGALLNMEPPPPPSPVEKSTTPREYDFSILHQKIELDVDFSTQTLKGRTEITLSPLSREFRQIKLDARQCVIDTSSVQVNGKSATFKYEDPFKKLVIPRHIHWTAHQAWMQLGRLPPQDRTADGSLVINLPKGVSPQQIGSFFENSRASSTRAPSVAGQDAVSAYPGLTPRAAADMVSTFEPITVSLSFSVKKFRDGLQFVGLNPTDKRYPHVYTKHSMDAGVASCIFPCADSATVRCPWSISITCPRTLGDAVKRKQNAQSSRNQSPSMEDVITLHEDEKLLDMVVICSGESGVDLPDPLDNSKKTVTFDIDTMVSAQHIGFAIGPFEEVDLAAENRGEDDMERFGQGQSLPIVGYCLPGRVDELRNTCVSIVDAVDWLMVRCGAGFPFRIANFVFIDDQEQDVQHAASVSLCSSRLLYPKKIIDTERETMRTLTHAVASQWMGVAIVAAEPSDRWVTIGLSHFMTGDYMRNACGNNDYLFRQKTLSDKLVALDIDRPSLSALGTMLHLGSFEYEFIALKAPLVLFILHKRIIKATQTTGLTRVITKMAVNANNGTENTVSTESFRKHVEKLNKYRQTEEFWSQWVFGAGCPRFFVTQDFVKKTSTIKMTIRQKQTDLLNVPRTIPKHDFLREFKESEVDAESLQACFTGPMTIRIHEADGTPYEHIVNITQTSETFMIPYATKYKRLKRSRRKTDQMAGAGGNNGDALYYSLGDVLADDDEIEEWDLDGWSPEDLKNMDNENYEWFRIDADFEWLCLSDLRDMKAYMYMSQLQQDRDVVAHQESMSWLSRVGHYAQPSTFAVKAFMDPRYNYNVRLMALDVLQNCALETLNWKGLKHLEKAYEALYCYPGTRTPIQNDFSNMPAYIVSKAMASAFSKIRDKHGRCPKKARDIVLDQLRFNDNQDNEYSDEFKIASLLEALTECCIPRKVNAGEMVFDDAGDEEEILEYDSFVTKVVAELDRHLRMDEWLETYRNIYTTTILLCKAKLMQAGVIPVDPFEFINYVHDGCLDIVRCKALEALIDLKYIANDGLADFFMTAMSTDISPFVRRRLYDVFSQGLAVVAFGPGVEKPVAQATVDAMADDLVVVDEVSNEHKKAHQVRTQTITGALAALKTDLGGNEALMRYIWEAAKSPKLVLSEQASLLEICGILYEPKQSLVLKVPMPKYWSVERTGKSTLVFKQNGIVRTKPRTPAPVLRVAAPQQPPSRPAISVPFPAPRAIMKAATPAAATPKLKFTIGPKPGPKHGSMAPPATTNALKRPLPADEGTINVDGQYPRKIAKLEFHKPANIAKMQAILAKPSNPPKPGSKQHRTPLPIASSPGDGYAQASPHRSLSSPAPVTAPRPKGERKPLPSALPPASPATAPAPRTPAEKKSKIVKLKVSSESLRKLRPRSLPKTS
ncbi:putative transcription initiation factor TFIID subunit 2 [Calycina marina]|uniref:Transcription initiation factor TFIID subunit 2 n=1 Tax=Calycina marina TaxID=1763456 RepID=A0A9P7Z8W1_9HELO|nr:putative transcription initiation factor TFIID subunit 2 [Calycina marina]